MYDQGNYPLQFGQSANRPPRPQFLQQVSHPPAPGGLLHRGPPVPPHGVIQQAGASAYHSAPISQSCSSSSIPQSYILQPPYQAVPQNAQYVSALPPPPPPPPPRGHSRIPPPPPCQTQNLYRGPFHQPSPGMQQIITPISASALPPPPPPPMPLQSSNLPTRATFHSVAPSTSEGSHLSSVTLQPPPLPPSPPPLPPPPPSSTPQSSLPLSSPQPMNSDPSVQALCDPGSIKTLNAKSVQNIRTRDRITDNTPNYGSGHEIETNSFDTSSLKGGMPTMLSVTVAVPTPPPRPTNEKILRNIEILCQFISKNGHAFEDMVRQKEAENSEFNFLFGGEPGSEAAITHKYYLWMKNKSCLQQNQTNSTLEDKHAESRSSVEPNSLNPTSHSLSDSDMDMEDDMIQPGEKLAVNDEVSCLKQDCVSSADGIEEQAEGDSLQSSQVGISTVRVGPPIKSGGDDGGMSHRNLDSVTHTDDPFRLLKGYASDHSSEDDARLEGQTFQYQEAVVETSDGCKMQDSSESKPTDVGFPGSHIRGAQCKQPKDLDAGPAIKISANDVISRPISLEKKVDKAVENNLKTDASKQSAVNNLEEKDALESSGAGVVSESDKARKEHKKSPKPVQVDEFGRLMREGASETDSDDSSYYRRRGRRRKSRSTSKSPPLRKRRRKSPWRGKERRSLSRSLSPKRRRSRSRSPFRRSIDIGGNNTTRVIRPQMGECFNFLKGRCYRGASCRYLHNDPKKYRESRHYRSKHDLETRASTRDCDYSEENKVTTAKGSLEYDMSTEEMHHEKAGEVKPYQKQHANSDYASIGAAVDKKNRAECVDVLIARSSFVSVIDGNNDTTPEGLTSGLLRTSDSKDASYLVTSNFQNDDNYEQLVSRGKGENVDHSQVESSKKEHDTLDNQTQHLRASCQTSTVQISPVSCQPSEAVLSLCKKSIEPVGQRDLLASYSSAINCAYHVSQLPPPPPLPLEPPSLHVATIPHALQPVQDYISVPSEANVLMSNRRAQYHTPQHPSWSTLPTPCTTFMVTPPLHSGPASFQQGSLPLRSDFSMQPSLKTKPTDRPIHLHVSNLQEQTYMSMQASHQPPPHVDAVHPGSLLGQAVTSSISVRDDRYVNPLSSGPFPSNSFPHGNIPIRPAPSFWEANSNRVQSFSHETLPSGGPSRSDFQNPPYLQQHPSYGLYQAAGDSFREPLSYSAELQRKSPSHICDTGSIITAHYKPFASTFDQPLSSKFSSDVFSQGKNPHDSEHENSFCLVSAPSEGQRVTYGVGPMITSPNFSRAGDQTLPKSGGDQYDPLFDSIEPSTESLKKQPEQEDHAADNSEIMLRLSGSKPLGANVNRNKKELGVVAAAISSENDEFGETAHAEVFAEEAGSQSNSNDGAGAASDVEIDQVKREGKSKRSKDSRSMKLFKVELASFVKDMLKPSWRQGNMSKEAFKTIVKKTVEKVSGAMKGHRAPKSKAKIDQYIGRSQRKLTMLVEGYVNKYAKA